METLNTVEDNTPIKIEMFHKIDLQYLGKKKNETVS